MKFIRLYLIILFFCTIASAADTKLTALTGLAQGNDDLLVYVVTDPNGSPLSRKIPWEELILPWDGTANITTLGTIATGTWQGTAVDHERGGLEADVSAYGGLVGINGGSTLDADTLAELLTAMSDVTKFFTDDDIVGPSADPDIDAQGELGIDTDGANEPNDVTLRTADIGGDTQYALAQVLKTINVTLISPHIIDAADLIPIWHNNSGMIFTITEWHAWSDDDDVSFELEEITDATDFTAITTIDACEVATNGTSVYYASDTTITHAAIEHDHLIAIDFDTTDTPDYLKVTITGWYNADVD